MQGDLRMNNFNDLNSCGCQNNGCGSFGGCNSCLWIIILLCLCGGGGGCQHEGHNSCCIIPILVALCCCGCAG